MQKQSTQGKTHRAEVDKMRDQVQEIELRARYWKAQYELRYFTLEAEKIQPEYEAYLIKTEESIKKANEELQAELEKLNQDPDNTNE
jgi:hypothetical protein